MLFANGLIYDELAVVIFSSNARVSILVKNASRSNQSRRWFSEALGDDRPGKLKQNEETHFMLDTSGKEYWKATLTLLFKVLVVWFLCSYGAGILFAPFLNKFYIGGYPLGFWFAQQGSIYIFIALIFYYAKKMGKIDRRFDVHEE